MRGKEAQTLQPATIELAQDAIDMLDYIVGEALIMCENAIEQSEDVEHYEYKHTLIQRLSHWLSFHSDNSDFSDPDSTSQNRALTNIPTPDPQHELNDATVNLQGYLHEINKKIEEACFYIHSLDNMLNGKIYPRNAVSDLNNRLIVSKQNLARIQANVDHLQSFFG